MTQRDLVTVAGGVVLGAVVVAAVMAMDFNPFRGGDKKTEVTLSPAGPNGACELGKSTLVRVGKSRNLTWEIENYCTSDQVVSVGNFRTDRNPVQSPNCDNIGTHYPFENTADRSITVAAATQAGDDVDPTEARIRLKVKGKKDLGEDELTYYFDVCLNGSKTDPVLVIER